MNMCHIPDERLTTGPLDEKEMNDFTRSRQISSKPHVVKMVYRNLDQGVHKADLIRLCQNL